MCLMECFYQLSEAAKGANVFMAQLEAYFSKIVQ